MWTFPPPDDCLVVSGQFCCVFCLTTALTPAECVIRVGRCVANGPLALSCSSRMEGKTREQVCQLAMLQPSSQPPLLYHNGLKITHLPILPFQLPSYEGLWEGRVIFFHQWHLLMPHGDTFLWIGLCRHGETSCLSCFPQRACLWMCPAFGPTMACLWC